MSKRICIFGASITHGVGDNEKAGWANRLRIYLLEKSDYGVYELGVSGNATSDLINRFDLEAEARKPEIIIFGIGANDPSYRESLGGLYIPLEKFKENLEILKTKAKKFTKKIIFVGLTKVDENKTVPISWGEGISYKNIDTSEYNQAIKDFCDKNNLPFIEMFDLLDNDDLADGLHPNSAGHEKIFQRVKDFLIENKII